MRKLFASLAMALVPAFCPIVSHAAMPDGVTQELLEVIANADARWKPLTAIACLAKPTCRDHVADLVERAGGEPGRDLHTSRKFEAVVNDTTMTFIIKPEPGRALCKALLSMNAMRPANDKAAPEVSTSVSKAGLEVTVKLNSPRNSYEAFVVLLSSSTQQHAALLAEGHCNLGADIKSTMCKGGVACWEQQF